MKLIFSILFVFAFYLPVFAQKDSSECPNIIDSLTQRKVYIFTDKMPEVEGGINELHKAIATNLKSPRTDCLTGKIVVGFIVDVEGNIIGKRIIKDPCNEFGIQVIEIIGNLKWIPGSCKGKSVPVFYKLPVTIDLK